MNGGNPNSKDNVRIVLALLIIFHKGSAWIKFETAEQNIGNQFIVKRTQIHAHKHLAQSIPNSIVNSVLQLN